MSAQPGRAGCQYENHPSAVGAAPFLPKHIFGNVRYAGLFQQLEELLVEGHFLVVFAVSPGTMFDVAGRRVRPKVRNHWIKVYTAADPISNRDTPKIP
jgi:hypothetical protein